MKLDTFNVSVNVEVTVYPELTEVAALIATVSPCNAVKLPVNPTIVLLLPPFIEYVHVGTVYPADGPEGDPEVLRLILLTVDTAEPVKVIVGIVVLAVNAEVTVIGLVELIVRAVPYFGVTLTVIL